MKRSHKHCLVLSSPVFPLSRALFYTRVENHFGYTCYDGLRPDDRDEAIRLLRERLGTDAKPEDILF